MLNETKQKEKRRRKKKNLGKPREEISRGKGKMARFKMPGINFTRENLPTETLTTENEKEFDVY